MACRFRNQGTESWYGLLTAVEGDSTWKFECNHESYELFAEVAEHEREPIEDPSGDVRKAVYCALAAWGSSFRETIAASVVDSLPPYFREPLYRETP
jgi:hypothetical protein